MRRITYLPDIASFRLAAQYVVEERPDELAGMLLDRIESHPLDDGTSGIGYLHLLWLVDRRRLMWFIPDMFRQLAEAGEVQPLRMTDPILVLSAELSGGPDSLQAQLTGDTSVAGPFFCAFDANGHRNFGLDPSVANCEGFEARALRTIRTELGLTLRLHPDTSPENLPL